MHPYNFFVRGPNFTKTLQKFQKFGEVAPPNPKVIGAHTPNFKPIFECSSLTIVGGDPRPQWGVR